MVKLIEYADNQAWNIIQDTTKLSLSEDYLAIVYIQSYLNKKKIKQHIASLGYADKLLKFSQFKKPIWLKLIPIATPYNFILYDIDLNNIYQLAKSCNSFLMFEVLILKRNDKIPKIKQRLLLKNSPIFYHLEFIKLNHMSYFFYGFDFDDPNFESGVSRAYDYNFVPSFFKKYFW